MNQTVATTQIQVAAPIAQSAPPIQINSIEAFVSVAVILVGMGAAWGTLKRSVSNIETTLKDDIKPDLKNVRERFMIVEDRVDTLWKDKFAPTASPRKLNERGRNILAQSGIKEVIEKEKDKLLGIVRKGKVANPYDAERTILEVVAKLPDHCPELIDSLKEGAFKVGADLDAVLFVGGIYLRDLIFSDLGFKLDDLDVPPEKVIEVIQ